MTFSTTVFFLVFLQSFFDINSWLLDNGYLNKEIVAAFYPGVIAWRRRPGVVDGPRKVDMIWKAAM